jgi:hypothetical protein
VPIQPIHPHKLFFALLAREWPVVCMQLLMLFVVVVPFKYLQAPRPFAYKRFPLVVAQYVLLQVEAPCECASTTWNRADERNVLPTSNYEF